MHPTHELVFAPPDYNRLDFDAALAAIPDKATVKGLFMQALLQAVEAHEQCDIMEAAGVPERRYTGFHDYPFRELVLIERALARRLHPDIPEGPAIRQLTTRFYAAFAETVAGRVLFGVLGRDARRVIPLGPRGWKICVGMGRVEGEVVAENHVRYHFHDYFGPAEAGDIGVVEGALRFCGVKGQAEIARIDRGNFVFDIKWS